MASEKEARSYEVAIPCREQMQPDIAVMTYIDETIRADVLSINQLSAMKGWIENRLANHMSDKIKKEFPSGK